MNASAFLRIALAAPASLLLAAGAAAACPPEISEKAPQVIELGDAGDPFLFEFNDDGSWLLDDAAMAVFADQETMKQGGFFGPGEGPQRYRVVGPSSAQAQTRTATRGNGTAQAQARAELGEALLRRGQPLREDAMTLQELPRKQTTGKQTLRLKSSRTPTPPPPPPAPAIPGESGAFVEGRAIIVGPDGQITERMMSGGQGLGALQPQQRPFSRRGRALNSANSQEAQREAEVRALETQERAKQVEGMPLDAATALPRVWIGVELAEPDASIVRYFELEPGQSSEIAKVYEGSPAQRAGLKDKDIVVKLNGAAMAGPDILREVVGASAEGDAIRITVLRKGRTHEIDLRPALREVPRSAAVEVSPGTARGGAPASPDRADLERRMERIERMLQELVENESRD